MKLRLQKRKSPAFTLPELLIILAIIVLMAILVHPGGSDYGRRAQRINCVSNLKELDLSFLIWAGDHDNKYPMAVSATNGGAMESVATGNVANCFIVMSNSLITPRVLVCPADVEHSYATNFSTDFNTSHISYFVGVDADGAYPQRIMSGDDTLKIGRVVVQPGLLRLSTNATIAWASGRHDALSEIPVLGIPLRHHYCGNIGYADGSVAEVSTLGLQHALVQTCIATNRLAIP